MKLKITSALIRVDKVMLQNKLESQWPNVTKVLPAHADV